MNTRLLTQLASIATALVCLQASPAGANDPLYLPEVLDAVEQTHPTLEAATREVERADANIRAARGGFDPLLTIRGKWTPVGYYPQGQVDALIRQATPVWGLSLFAGYRMGWGSYPIYKGDLQTLSGGEVRAGLEIPLWRDGPIDKRRAAIAEARVRGGGARNQKDAAQLELEGQAAEAYWSWVAAGQQTIVARDLLEIAQRRQEGLAAQVEAGSIERIKLIDNQRLVLERQDKLVEAEQKLRNATIKLSLYLRDNDNRPLLVDEQRVPKKFPPNQLIDAAIDAEVERALANRPDVLALRAEREAKAVKLRLARNRRAPEVNVQAFVSKDMGDGPAELRPAELGAGVVFAMPLPLRQARGEYQAAKAELAAVDAKLRGLRDKVAAEIREAHVNVDAANRRVSLAQQQVAAADELAAAERERLANGYSNLINVNIRELAAAKAATQEIDARANYQKAKANLQVATGRSPVP